MKKIHRIIVVGEDKLYAYQTQQLLEALAVAEEVKVIYDGWDAVQYVVAHYLPTQPEKEQPDLLFLDINALDKNDFELLLRFQSLELSPAKLQLVLHGNTINAGNRIKPAFETSHVLGQLEKPLQKEAVLELLGKRWPVAV